MNERFQWVDLPALCVFISQPFVPGQFGINKRHCHICQNDMPEHTWLILDVYGEEIVCSNYEGG